MGAAGVLAGVRIVEIGAEGTASLATRALAEQGATVIRIEWTQRPGALRTSHARAGEPTDLDASRRFARLNPDKWSVAIDVHAPAGAALVARLAARVDVLAMHGESSALDGLGLVPTALLSRHPQLVVLTGPAGDVTVDPLMARGMALSVAAALLARARTGIGRHIDVSDLEAVVRGVAAGRVLRWPTPVTGFHPCADGTAMAIEIGCDADWRALVVAMGSPAWAADARFATASDRETHREALDQALATFTREHPPYPLMARLQQAGVRAGVVQDFQRVLRDPQLAHRHHFTVLDHAALGRMPYERGGIRIGASSGGFDDSAPLLGEDGDVVLGEFLGLSPEQIETLIADGIIG